MRGVERVLDRLERAEQLDAVADRAAAFWGSVLSHPKVRDLLSGRALGHPLHPAAVLVPAGTLLSATWLDLSGPRTPAARRLIGTGLLAATPAALAGWNDWLDTEQAERRVGIAHAATNILGLSGYAVSFWRRGRGGSGLLTSVLGAAALGVGGWLGGHLAYAEGVGVDTTAFQSGPQEWTDVAAAAEVGSGLHRGVAGDVPVLLTRVDGWVVALEDRCSHRGAPLSEGSREGDCVVCPWHASAFSLRDGDALRGPASRPQPTYEVRERDGRIEVRRDETRALRANPTHA